jgi:uncharacterized protein (TIGR02680 family)
VTAGPVTAAPGYASPPRHSAGRWRLARAGIVNVWQYLDNEFDLSGGRMILRGTNGSGKSRALEMLLPFLLDADRRKMDATGMAKVSLDELMRIGAGDQANRSGYLWLELARPGEHLTLGAHIRFSRSANRTQVWYFSTPLRVGQDLPLLMSTREVLSRDALTDLVGPEQVTDSAEAHRERVRVAVFGLGGAAGRDRYAGLLQLLHTLRAPDVGNRIDEGKLPLILRDALPPLREETISRAGEQLDGLSETRESQRRLEESLAHVQRFLGVYRRYAAGVLLDAAARAEQAVGELAGAERQAAELTDSHLRLERQLVGQRAARAELEDQLTELTTAIRGIEARAVFKTADDLRHRDRAVEALAQAADSALDAAGQARRGHRGAVDDADGRLAEAQEAVDECAHRLAAARAALRAAALPDGGLPEEVRGRAETPGTTPAIVRVTRDGDPYPVERPLPGVFQVWPADTEAAQEAALTAAEAGGNRAELAERRLLEARRLAGEEQQVRAAEAEAQQLAAVAETDQTEAVRAADARDDQAVALASAWRGWIGDPLTAELLGPADWAALAVGELLVDLQALTGTGEAGPALAALDEVAGERAVPARDAIAVRRQELAAAERADQAAGDELRAEQAELAAARDPAPAEPPWLRPDRDGVPLWRAVDFAAALQPADRAGLEGALLAAGLLTARIEADGTVRAGDGEVLLAAGAVPAARPLSAALTPDPAGGLPAELVRSVLATIGLGDERAGTSVTTDGSWRNGPLRGRYVTAEARHIGAQARARRRAARLAEIAAALAALARAADQRGADRDRLADQERRLTGHLRAAPRSSELHAARAAARTAAGRAAGSRTRAAEAAGRASRLRTRWAGELATHRETCRHYDLPAQEPGLEAIRAAAQDAVRRCEAAAEEFRALGRLVGRHTASLEAERRARADRDSVEELARQRWAAWHELAATVAAMHESIDLEEEQARAELQRTQHAYEETRGHAREVAETLASLGQQVGTAQARRDQAVLAVQGSRARLVEAARAFSRTVVLPGLLAAATDQEVAPIEAPEVGDAVRAAAEGLQEAVRKPSQPATENAVLSAFQTFDRELSGQLDVRDTVRDGVHLVEVAGAGDDRTLAGAAAALARLVEVGRAALTERERQVFTTFVLGGVAEELRRRVNQARELVAAMNASLREIRTTNGIGVRLSWRLSEEHAGLSRVLELVATADAVRSVAQNEELTELLRREVESRYAGDPTSGYAVHLAAALDYRAWHEVQVVILGPQPGQERHLSRRAKLSQGETRFVSYVALFAAADGYLSGLPDTEHALRLVLLDDAFAKVDDRTVAELMGLLVHLDVDFVMTGHALWGCFPQVPKLDIYEVRRLEGTSAVTTHVHWDGRNRSFLRPATT